MKYIEYVIEKTYQPELEGEPLRVDEESTSDYDAAEFRYKQYASQLAFGDNWTATSQRMKLIKIRLLKRKVDSEEVMKKVKA